MAYDISVVVPHLNGLQYLKERLLPALLAQCDVPFELIIADDGSDDFAAVETLVYSFNFASARVLRLPHGGVAAARNAGVKAASGSVIAITDADCVPEPAWLATVAKAIRDHGLELVYGKVVTDRGYLFPRWAAPAGERFVGANFAFRKSTFDQLGGFRPLFAGPFREDTDFGLRAIELNMRVASLPSAEVYHPLRKQRLKKLFFSGYWHLYDAELLKRFGDSALTEIGKGHARPILGTGVSLFGAACTLVYGAALVLAMRGQFATAIGLLASFEIAVAAATLVITLRDRDDRSVGEVIENAISAIPYSFGWYVGRVQGSVIARKLCI